VSAVQLNAETVMKKFFVSIGLAAAGTASLQAAYAPGLGPMETTKLWSLSATLRGFYDDNYNTAPDGPDKQGSYGFEFSPSFSLNVPLQQTEIGLRYTYGLYYYQERQEKDETPVDQSHELDLWVDHAFTERVQGSFMDSFVIGQEPELLSQGEAPDDPDRVEGNNIVNTGTFTLHNDWTRLFSTDLGFKNGFYDYENHGGSAGDPSLAGLLNRVEDTAWLNLNWQVRPETVALIGFQYEQINYIWDEPIAPAVIPLHIPERFSSDRDNRSYTGYVGVQHNFLPNLTFAANVGIEYNEDYNDPLDTISLSPYAVASLTYTYAPGSYAQIGVNHMRNATDQIDLNTSNGSIALDQESSLVFANINHELTSKLLATAIGQVAYSTYNGGTIDGQSDTLYSFGLNLNYSFNPHFSTEVGYNFDRLESAVATQDYTRNRVYVGVSAAY